MSEERTRGIILRARPLTETSLIVHWLTPDLGRVATVAKGARRVKSPFRGKLDLFHAAEFSFVRSRRSELHTLREAVLRETHPALRRDVSRLQQAAYAVALLELATETETPLPEFFDLFSEWLAFLNRHAALRHGLLAFEIRFLRELGLAPSTGSGRAASPLMEQLNSLAWEQLAALHPEREALGQVERRLAGLLLEHLGRVPRSRSSALEA